MSVSLTLFDNPAELRVDVGEPEMEYARLLLWGKKELETREHLPEVNRVEECMMDEKETTPEDEVKKAEVPEASKEVDESQKKLQGTIDGLNKKTDELLDKLKPSTNPVKK